MRVNMSSGVIVAAARSAAAAGKAPGIAAGPPDSFGPPLGGPAGVGFPAQAINIAADATSQIGLFINSSVSALLELSPDS